MPMIGQEIPEGICQIFHQDDIRQSELKSYSVKSLSMMF